MSRFHREAGSAACHSLAVSDATTDWQRVLFLYDYLMELTPTPIVALNRAVAVARVHGPEAGLRAINAIPDRASLRSYYFIYTIAAELYRQLKHYALAIQNYRAAIHHARLQEVLPSLILRRLSSPSASRAAPRPWARGQSWGRP